jgi:MFS transporter, SP family, galactose:H+ symporter
MFKYNITLFYIKNLILGYFSVDNKLKKHKLKKHQLKVKDKDKDKDGESNREYNKNHTLMAFFIMFIAGMGGVLYGYDIGIINGVLLFITSDIPMNNLQLGIIVGAVLIPSALATIVTGKLADWFGRRLMMQIASLVFLISVIFLVLSNSYHMLLYSRWLQGLSVGIVVIVVPLYLAEIMPVHLRGRGVGVFQLLLTFGILLGTFINYLLADTHDWKLMFATSAVPAIILFIGCFFIPKSPRWLLMKGHSEKALKSLKYLNPIEKANSERDSINNHLIQDNAEIGVGFTSFLRALGRRHFLVPFLIVICVAILGQTTGINSILQYSAIILSHAGLSSDSGALLGTNLITAVNFIVTFIALCLVDRIGRKFLLIIGTALVTASLIYCGCIYAFCPLGDTKAILLMIGLVVYIIGFAIGPGACIFIILSELLPSNIRSLGMGIAICLNSLVGGVFASYFLFFVGHIGYSGVFWVCAVLTFIYFLIVAFILPETKNKSLEEIEESFIKQK